MLEQINKLGLGDQAEGSQGVRVTSEQVTADGQLRESEGALRRALGPKAGAIRQVDGLDAHGVGGRWGDLAGKLAFGGADAQGDGGRGGGAGRQGDFHWLDALVQHPVHYHRR